MALRSILVIPDDQLRKTAEPVTSFTPALAKQIEDMFETMYDAPGIGLAAPQIGIMNRVIVVDCGERAAREEASDEDVSDENAVEEKTALEIDLGGSEDDQDYREPIAMINPEITSFSEDTKVYEEGCLSIPDYYEDVERPAEISVRYQTPDGETVERVCDGLLAVCVQHEVDHLNGKLFIDFLSRLKRERITKKFQKAARRAG